MSLLTKTRIDIDETTRIKVINILNQGVVDAIDLKLQTKQAHWNIKGPSFIGLHELFDKFAKDADDYTDLVAERAIQLGGTAEGTVQRVAVRTHLPEYPVDIHGQTAHLEALAGAWANFAKHTRTAINQTDELGDKDTADIFTEVSRGADMNLWFIEAHLHPV